MKTILTSFFCLSDKSPQPIETQLDLYIPLLLAQKRALLFREPDAHHAVICDAETKQAVEATLADLLCYPTAPSDERLMVQSVVAQRRFLEDEATHLTQSHDSFVVLADADCVPARPLQDALPAGVIAGATYNDKGLRIINVGYVRGRRGALAFSAMLNDAESMIRRWPQHLQDWFGDQEAWDMALGWRHGSPGTPDYHARVGVFPVNLYPCSTHNHIPLHSGTMKNNKPFIVHFKGDRKEHMLEYVRTMTGETF